MKNLISISWILPLALLSGCGGGSSATSDPPPDPPPVQESAYTVLHTFKGGAEGKNPTAGLIRDASGNLYGTTSSGGDPACPDGFGGGCGTVFKLDPSGVLTTLHAFAGGPTNGANPQGGLIRDAANNFYGTTAGGAFGYGTIFKLDATGNESVLHHFAGGAGGMFPNGRLLRDTVGNLYGTTQFGGYLDCEEFYYRLGCGAVFKLDPNGVFTTLHVFAVGTTDGALPNPGLIRDADGNVYGSTTAGGDRDCSIYVNVWGCGTVFKLDATGSESVLYHFTGEEPEGTAPQGALIGDGAGNLYGTTYFGGYLGCDDFSYGLGCGTVFKLDPGGTLTTLFVFGQLGQRTDLKFPTPGLIRDSAGNLYGTALDNQYSPVMYRLTASGSETSLYSFTGAEQGIRPILDFLEGAGNFYGTAFAGGDPACDPVNEGCGLVFKSGPP